MNTLPTQKGNKIVHDEFDKYHEVIISGLQGGWDDDELTGLQPSVRMSPWFKNEPSTKVHSVDVI